MLLLYWERDCMICKMIEKDIEEATKYLTNIIYRKYKENTHGAIKGYLVPDHDNCVISKGERKYFSSLDTPETNKIWQGSVKCSETKRLTRSLTAMVIAYTVRNNLTEYFTKYPFKKFKIEMETYPKYRYEKTRLIKYRKTGDDITFLKVDIEW